MTTLAPALRNKLEHTVVVARDVAETGSRAALESMAVHHHEPYSHMTTAERQLRIHLRARARHLGDKQDKRGFLEIHHLIRECAYEHWHRMLFARFLAETDLLIEPEMAIPISLKECEELAQDEGTDLWTLASRYAQEMLPRIFRPDDPLLKVSLPREYQLRMEHLLEELESDVFKSSDSLGWVYQFWQSKRKKEINESDSKIGANELPAVTQLFTEPYMVEFLLHNTLGAWWYARRLKENPELAQSASSEDELRQVCALGDVTWTYLRLVRHDGCWRPGSGSFNNWPVRASEIKVLDPCCGSGHFLVAAFPILVQMRIAEEGLSPKDAVDAVIRDNLFGLEIDTRCTEIASFSLALAAWRYPGAGGYRALAEINVACSGLSIGVNKEDWLELAGDDERLRNGMDNLFEVFVDGTLLGSLIDPLDVGANGKQFALHSPQFEELRPLLDLVAKQASVESDVQRGELHAAAKKILKAAEIICQRFTLIATNVPYLTRGKQAANLKDFCERNYLDAKQNLATVFLSRCLNLTASNGTSAIVLPEDSRFLKSYTRLRRALLSNQSVNFVAALGPAAFHNMNWWANRTMLLIVSQQRPPRDWDFGVINLGDHRETSEKPSLVRSTACHLLSQSDQLKNPDARIVLEGLETGRLLSDYSEGLAGVQSGDYSRFGRGFWEIPVREDQWVFQQSTVRETDLYSGREHILFWENGLGALAKSESARIQGQRAWGKKGVLISQMRHLPASLYTGDPWDNNAAVILPSDVSHL